MFYNTLFPSACIYIVEHNIALLFLLLFLLLLWC